MDANHHRSTGNHQPPKLPAVELPQRLDADLTTAQQIGYAIADTQLMATKRSYQQRYNTGIDSFLKVQAGEDAWQQAQQLGAHLAAVQLEERRRVLIQVGLRTGAIAIPTYGLAVLFGFNPLTAGCIVLPAVVTAFWLR